MISFGPNHLEQIIGMKRLFTEKQNEQTDDFSKKTTQTKTVKKMKKQASGIQSQ